MALTRLGVLAAVLSLSLGCDRDGASDASSSSHAPTSASARGGEAGGWERRLALAERARDVERVLPDDLRSRDVARRRRAVAALARVEAIRVGETLVAALSDPDPEVIAWAAYGLGRTCRVASSSVAGALVVRAATLEAPVTGSLDPYFAIADALGRCGGPRAEKTLETWLAGPEPVARAAPFGLGRLSPHEPLDDDAVTAILDAAAANDRGGTYALYPLTYALELTDAQRARVSDIAGRALERPGTQRGLAIRALVNADARADALLGGVVEDARAGSAERQSAARTLGARGDAGQERLARAVEALAQRLAAGSWSDAEPLLAAVSSLDAEHAPPSLPGALKLEKPDELGVAQKRRLTLLRCRVAALRAGGSVSRFRRMVCENDGEGRAFSLALLSVLDRARLVGDNRMAWKALLASKDPVVRQAALRLIASHPELDGKEALTAALGDANFGTATTAAQIIAAYPGRFGPAAGKNQDAAGSNADRAAADKAGANEAAKTLERLVASEATPLEARAAAIQAAAALQLLSVKPALEKYCRVQQPVLRKQAEASLRMLGSPEAACDDFDGLAAPPAPPAPVTPGTRLEFVTDAGKLRIDVAPELAPAAAARLVELSRRGFFDGMAVHRVVPGFVVQFGDGDGDGFGAGEAPPLPCETAPVPFEPGSVGVALAGRDTGATQFFVAVGPYPHLSGDYTRVGRASGGWDKLVVGDVIRSVAVTP